VENKIQHTTKHGASIKLRTIEVKG